MNNLPSWVSTVQAIWVAVGTFLFFIASQGVQIPDFLTQLLSQETFEAFTAVLGSVLVFYQYIRAIFVKESAGDVQILSNGQKASYALNPFKTKL